MFARIRPDTWSHLAIAAALIVGVLVAGTVGYTLLGLGAVDAAYQTIVTVSTVGFREIADGDPDTTWKAFTSVLILLGTGSMLYGATSVIESIVEGRLSGQFRRYRMQRSIDDLAIRQETGAVALSVRDRSERFHADDVTSRPFADGDVIVAIGSDAALDRLAGTVSS